MVILFSSIHKTHLVHYSSFNKQPGLASFSLSSSLTLENGNCFSHMVSKLEKSSGGEGNTGTLIMMIMMQSIPKRR